MKGNYGARPLFILHAGLQVNGMNYLGALYANKDELAINSLCLLLSILFNREMIQ